MKITPKTKHTWFPTLCRHKQWPNGPAPCPVAQWKPLWVQLPTSARWGSFPGLHSQHLCRHISASLTFMCIAHTKIIAVTIRAATFPAMARFPAWKNIGISTFWLGKIHEQFMLVWENSYLDIPSYWSLLTNFGTVYSKRFAYPHSSPCASVPPPTPDWCSEHIPHLLPLLFSRVQEKLFSGLTKFGK